MHTTYLKFRDGREVSGYIWEWRPREGWFTLNDDVTGEQHKVTLADLLSGYTKGERISKDHIGDQDILERARRDGWYEHKQVLVYRRDLKMRKGKIAAQCAHASMKVFIDRAISEKKNSQPWMRIPLTPEMYSWLFEGKFAKVVLSVETEEDLLTVHRLALERGIPTALVTDAGFTEFGGKLTKTVVALGPARISEIDAITGPEGLVSTKLA